METQLRIEKARTQLERKIIFVNALIPLFTFKNKNGVLERYVKI